jgi:hypothetical protein
MAYHPPFSPTKIGRRCVVFYLQNSAPEGRWKNKALIFFFCLKNSFSIYYLFKTHRKHSKQLDKSIYDFKQPKKQLKNSKSIRT